MKTPEEVKTLIQEAVNQAAEMYQGSYREVCIGIEAMCQELKKQKLFVTRLLIKFQDSMIEVSEVDVDLSKPKDFNLEGIWTVLYSSVCPRYTPFGPDPLRVASLEVGYGINPRVSYDASFDNGLPMGFNRKYDPDKIKAGAGR